jgi:hypothetical protein
MSPSFFGQRKLEPCIFYRLMLGRDRPSRTAHHELRLAPPIDAQLLLRAPDVTHPTAQNALSLQQALMKLIGQNGIEDVVLPFAIDF